VRAEHYFSGTAHRTSEAFSFVLTLLKHRLPLPSIKPNIAGELLTKWATIFVVARNAIGVDTVGSASPGRSCAELQTVESVRRYTVSAKPYYLPHSPVTG
jgi:hypothetical protein